jgi:tRNA pseudouridine38-40 synthase
MILEYDGGGYHGWQIQPRVLTIQEVIEEKIHRITQQASRVVAAGRTDAGVHALRQVVHFHTQSCLSVEAIRRALNALLPSDIRILKTEELSREFHARYSALGKRYEYRIWNGSVRSAFHDRYAWWIPVPLDFEAMQTACIVLIGRHDFSSFRSAGCDGKHAVREVKICGWRRKGQLLVFYIEANAFLKYMVRAIVGTLVEVGMGKSLADTFAEILRACDRTKAGMTAPARGLFLASVFYPKPWHIDMDDGRGL